MGHLPMRGGAARSCPRVRAAAAAATTQGPPAPGDAPAAWRGIRWPAYVLESPAFARCVPTSLPLFNSLTRQVEAFAPLDPASPTTYLRVPTVHHDVHLGHARGPVVFGVLAALLRRRHGALRYARNITDVDDKINAAAREQGVPISVVTDRFAAAYREDMAALGVDGAFAPDIEPAAT